MNYDVCVCSCAFLQYIHRLRASYTNSIVSMEKVWSYNSAQSTHKVSAPFYCGASSTISFRKLVLSLWIQHSATTLKYASVADYILGDVERCDTGEWVCEMSNFVYMSQVRTRICCVLLLSYSFEDYLTSVSTLCHSCKCFYPLRKCLQRLVTWHNLLKTIHSITHTQTYSLRTFWTTRIILWMDWMESVCLCFYHTIYFQKVGQLQNKLFKWLTCCFVHNHALSRIQMEVVFSLIIYLALKNMLLSKNWCIYFNNPLNLIWIKKWLRNQFANISSSLNQSQKSIEKSG